MDKRMKAQEDIQSLKQNMIGQKYRHFKGNYYVVLDIAIHSETAEAMIIYRSDEEPKNVWCRPLDMFLSKVDKKKYPEVEQKFRFERVIKQKEN